LTVPIIDENNIAINSDNDDITACLQMEIKADCVLHLIEAPALLLNPNDENSAIKYLNYSQLIKLEENSNGRIKRKLHSIRKLIDNGCKKIIISDGRIDHPISAALNGNGTIIS